MQIRTSHDLGAVVRGRRQDLGWTQTELAARAGLSRKWISEVESGKATVVLSAVLRVLEALGLTVQASLDSSSSPLDEHLNRLRER